MRLLVAVSGPSFQCFSRVLNVRFREKQTFKISLSKFVREGTALPPEAALGMVES